MFQIFAACFQTDISLVKTFLLYSIIYTQKMIKQRTFEIGRISNDELIKLTLGQILTGRLEAENIQN